MYEGEIMRPKNRTALIKWLKRKIKENRKYEDEDSRKRLVSFQIELEELLDK